jgi:hypothetical protein
MRAEQVRRFDPAILARSGGVDGGRLRLGTRKGP